MQSDRGMHGNAAECRECQGNIRQWVQIARGVQGNAGECQGNVREWVQSGRGMQWNARGT